MDEATSIVGTSAYKADAGYSEGMSASPHGLCLAKTRHGISLVQQALHVGGTGTPI